MSKKITQAEARQIAEKFQAGFDWREHRESRLVADGGFSELRGCYPFRICTGPHPSSGIMIYVKSDGRVACPEYDISYGS